MKNRRPLKVRQVSIAKKCATWLKEKGVTPNQISLASIIFAALASLCVVVTPVYGNVGRYDYSGDLPRLMGLLLPILAALLIQGRLLCNLFDGMVAIEGGQSTAAGELFNDIPDRIADPMILLAAGYSISNFDVGITLGWCAALLAIMTAYVRTLAASIGAPLDFQGPMAKQHRMAVMTIALLFTAIELFIGTFGYSILIALVIVIGGSLITIVRRVRSAYISLEH